MVLTPCRMAGTLTSRVKRGTRQGDERCGISASVDGSLARNASNVLKSDATRFAMHIIASIKCDDPCPEFKTLEIPSGVDDALEEPECRLLPDPGSPPPLLSFGEQQRLVRWVQLLSGAAARPAVAVSAHCKRLVGVPSTCSWSCVWAASAVSGSCMPSLSLWNAANGGSGLR